MTKEDENGSGWSYWMLCNSLLIVSWSCFVVLLWYHHHFITALLVFPEYWDYLLLMLCCAVVRRSIDWWLVVMNWSEECESSDHRSGNTSQVSVLRSPAPVQPGKILQSICSGFESILIHLLNSRFIIGSSVISLFENLNQFFQP